MMPTKKMTAAVHEFNCEISPNTGRSQGGVSDSRDIPMFQLTAVPLYSGSNLEKETLPTCVSLL